MYAVGRELHFLSFVYTAVICSYVTVYFDVFVSGCREFGDETAGIVHSGKAGITSGAI